MKKKYIILGTLLFNLSQTTTTHADSPTIQDVAQGELLTDTSVSTISEYKEKIAKLEKIMADSQKEIEKVEQENADILKEILEKSGVGNKLLKIIIESPSNDEIAKKMKELAEIL